MLFPKTAETTPSPSKLPTAAPNPGNGSWLIDLTNSEGAQHTASAIMKHRIAGNFPLDRDLNLACAVSGTFIRYGKFQPRPLATVVLNKCMVSGFIEQLGSMIREIPNT